ncbi:MAG TPA: hypothetical protein VHD39_03315, partial [Acidimicrobiales bacterium]|nr:hypothetical protein [Acidimicrobiales bacterium]
MTTLALLGTSGAGAPGDTGASAATPGGPAASAVARAGNAAGAPLTLVSQTPWVSAAQPWFNIDLGVGSSQGAASGLHVSLTFYGRLNDSSQVQQAISGNPPTESLGRSISVPVSANTAGGLSASACVTVVPQSSTGAPTAGDGACPAGAPTLVLGCTPLKGTCGDVYPLTVALLRQGSSNPVAHFTSFLTYQEPSAVGATGPLRVALVLPVAGQGFDTMADALATRPDVAATLAVSPATVNTIDQQRSRGGTHALEQLEALPNDEVINDSYVPINLAALSEAGISGEITAQMQRGDDLLRTAGLEPEAGPWVDPASSFSQGDASNLATGLQVAGATQVVLSDSNLASGGLSNYTFAQPFGLDLGGTSPIPAAAVNSTLSARFTAHPQNPVLSAEQLLAALSFVHFEDPYLSNARGIVVAPPSGWRPSADFMHALLDGLSGNQVLSPVTLAQYFQEVPAGGGPNDREPTERHLQSGGETHGITHNAADRIGLARQQLASYADAVKPGHPPELTSLSDALLATEARGLSPAGRAAALGAYDKAFEGVTGKI